MDKKSCGIRNCLVMVGPKMDSLFGLKMDSLFGLKMDSLFGPCTEKEEDKKKANPRYENNGQKPQDHVSKLQHLEDNSDPGIPAPNQNRLEANKNNQKNEDVFVKDSMPLRLFIHNNKADETPMDIFTKSHKDLVKQCGEWLTTTSNSCSVVAALIATVAFSTASTVPGGNSSEGKPTLESQPAFDVFAIALLVALCFSVTALVMFLAILTSRHQERDFRTSLPRKLLLGLTSLFVSMTAMLVYAVTCLPVTFFAIA
ncbi:unnamed protein product [Camellia sinensis]